MNNALYSRANLTRDAFVAVRTAVKTTRGHLSEIAQMLPGHASGRGRFVHAPLICDDGWISCAPVQLGIPGENLEDDSSKLITTIASGEMVPRIHLLEGSAFLQEVQHLLPLADGDAHPFRSFHAAIRVIEGPPEDLFVSRPSYSLADLAPGPPQILSFRQSNYFDYIDCGELLAFELALEANRLGLQGLPVLDGESSLLDERLRLRQLAGDWRDISARPSIAGVSVLTVFVDARRKKATFPMMQRSSKVAAAMGALHVIPAGEFQPTRVGPIAFENHCTLWQTILREFGEEILLCPEAKSYGLDMLELAALEKIHPLVELVRSGDWKSYYLGTALDPLTLKPEIMMVSVIDKSIFLDAAEAFLSNRALPIANSEGELARGPGGWGEQLTTENLVKWRDNVATLPAGRGCLELFLGAADQILPGYL